MTKTLNDLRDEAYEIALEHGFHDEERCHAHSLMLIITELSEAVEADRKNRHTDYNLLDQAKAEGIIFEDFFPTLIKDTFEDELADAAIRCLDFCGLHNIDLSDVNEAVTTEGGTDGFLEEEWGVTESVFFATSVLSSANHPELKVKSALFLIFALADKYRVDLFGHIDVKMAYNANRPFMHGKKY